MVEEGSSMVAGLGEGRRAGGGRLSVIRVAVAQPTTVLGAVTNNIAAHTAAVQRAASDLVVFPEMSLTGYDMNAPTIAVDDARLVPLIGACRETSTVALAGTPVHTGAGRRGIGVLAVSGEGVEVAYVKMSLGKTEARYFEVGQVPAVIEVRGWRVGIGVCKDTRIGDHLERTAAQNVDLYVAGLVHAPGELSELGARARRIAATYKVPVAFAGFAGPTGGGFVQTCGGSGIWDSTGILLQQLGPEPGTVVSVEL
ncbi:carbon-nitrogen hydrolase family protein [Nocardia vinacea]|uniref:carbon-nitrogen hydrolase family protein n=1 Tax=Nocardia vinacea TaxID=96468 RepID=UPI0033DB23CF